VVMAENQLRDQHLDMLRRLQTGQAPRLGTAQWRSADRDLNLAYRAAMQTLRVEAEEYGAWDGGPTAEGLRRSQRAWLRYRDAFIAFASVKFPRVPRDSLAAWLTRQRADSLSLGTE